MLDLTFKVAGQAGQGMQSISFALGKLFTRAGYHVFINQDVMSRIRGGHNFAQIRIRDTPVHGPSDKVNLLIALDDLSLNRHETELVPDGVAIFDSELVVAPEPALQLFPVPLTKLAKSVGRNPIMVNAVALGAVLYLTEYPVEPLRELLRETFAGKGSETVKANLACVQAGADYARQHFRGACPCRIALPAKESGAMRGKGAKRLFLTGNEAIAMGAVCSGVKFHSGYPMSPSTPIMEFLAAHGKELGIIVEQSEDEIAGISMALGASYAGVRAMTATSGGGFALMIESLGLAAISETPIVIVICSRPGPATGFPTRTEQADLLFTLYAGQDEFPRFIFAPGTAEQAFYAVNRAFDLAQKYQVPAIVLSDQLLSDSGVTVDDFDLERMRIESYDADRDWQDKEPYTYSRYAVAPRHDLPLPADVCPRISPGLKNQVVVAAGHEHSGSGYMTESAETRAMMTERRLGKTEAMRAELGGISCYPESPGSSAAMPFDRSETALLCFGSTYGAVREAIDLLRGQGINATMVHLSELSPLPASLLNRALEQSRRLITVENNATAQLAQLLHAETRLLVRDSVLKYDGRPFTAAEIAREVRLLS
jgi:2-oxoglutarate ferredoxin oxidoreductase subunit alpha